MNKYFNKDDWYLKEYGITKAEYLEYSLFVDLEYT